MKQTAPLVLYGSDGVRRVVGEAEVSYSDGDFDGEFEIFAVVKPEYAHLFSPDLGDFSFNPIEAIESSDD